ncbi:MAG: TonB-dependent receptor [Gemmatimonadota bacterium]
MRRGALVLRACLTACMIVVGVPTLVPAQEPVDTLAADTLATDSIVRYDLQGITIDVPRPTTTAGGSSTVDFRLDSVSLRPAPTLEEALRAMPLITIRTNSRGEAQPALRGAEDRQIAVLVDGVPLTLGWDARTDLSVIPLTAARRIRLVRGLSTILHGPNVLGGAVEIDIARGSEGYERPEPLTAHFGMDHTGGASFSLSGGTLAEMDRGAWEIRAGVGFQDHDGTPLPNGIGGGNLDARFLSSDGDIRLNSDVHRIDGFASARYRSDGGPWLSAVGLGFQSERGVPPEAHVQDPRLWRYPHQRRTIVALSGGTGFHETSLGLADLEASIGLDVGRTEIDAFASEAFDEVVDTELGDDRTLTLRLMGDAGVTDATELRAAVTFADVDHDEVIGGGSEAAYSQRLWSIGGEVEQRFGGLLGIPGLATTRLTVGVAADGSDTPESGDKPALDRLWDWGARLGLSSISDGGATSYHVSVSRRTRFPALRELYSGALGRFEPNPDLRPEVLIAGEAGFTVHAGDGSLQLVGFHQRLQDGIVRTSIQSPEGSRFQRVNQDAVHSTGLELLANTRFWGTVLTGDLTVQDVTGKNPDGSAVELEYEPAFMAKLGAQREVFMDFVASADFSVVGTQLCQNPEIGGLESFDTGPRVDLGIRRNVGLPGYGGFGRGEASLAVQNVGDAAVFDQCGLPQPGRMVSLRFRIW